ncbi:hypothetical protein LSAT2_028755, partial [Lamellibrachia satsuma]
ADEELRRHCTRLKHTRIVSMDREQIINLCWNTRTFTEKNKEDGSIEIHRVSLITGKSAIFFWLSGVCFITSIVGVSLKSWIKTEFGLFDMHSRLATKAFCVMGVITAGCSFTCAAVYIFVDVVPKRLSMFLFQVSMDVTAVFFLITDIGFMIGLTVLSTKAFMMVSSAYFCMIAALVFAGICSLVAKKQSKQAEKAGRPKRTPKVKLRTRKLEVEDVEDEDNDVEDVEGVEVSDQEDE